MCLKFPAWLLWSRTMSGHKRLANAESMLQQSGRKQTFQSSAWQTTNIFYTSANIFYKSAVGSCAQLWSVGQKLHSCPEYRENWMGKWESRWCREIQIMNMNLDRSGWSNPLVLACGYEHSLQKLYKHHGNQEHHSMCPDHWHWSIYFCTL